MSSLRKHDGYLLIDHRASPGLPADIAQAVNLDPKQCGEGQVLEAATLSCSHCRCVVVINPLRTRERAYCAKCDHYICDLCAAAACQAAYQHLPYAKLTDLTFDAAEKGVILGSSQDLLRMTKSGRE